VYITSPFFPGPWAVSLMRQCRNRFFLNADHTRRIKKGRDVTKSDACAQGRNEGGARGAQFPGHQFTMGTLNHCKGAELLMEAPKNPNNVTSTFFNTVNLPSK